MHEDERSGTCSGTSGL